MRLLLTLLLSWLLATPLFAQTDTLGQHPTAWPALATPPVASGPLPVAVPDTAAAIHRLFVRRRIQRTCLFLGTLAGGICMTNTAHYDAHHWPDPVGAGVSGFAAVGFGVFTGLVGAVELGLLNKASAANERQAIALWRAHQLPPEIRQRLKPRYFRHAN